jgi:lipoate---protein ligase
MLLVIDHTFPSPEENLAFDDDLLEAGRETLRFWESPTHFVVLGRSGKPEKEVNLGACAEAGVPVLRRSSGGGTVLQGPGCLNYALSLSLSNRPELVNVQASYRILLSEIAGTLRFPGLTVCGSDILLGDKKVSGNAQRRTRGWLLHHGTVLHGLDLNLMERLLLEPPRQPAHRRFRTHRQFVTSLQDDKSRLKHKMNFLSVDSTYME